MELDKDQIKEVQQNREPYLMLDYVTNLVPGKLCDSYKDLNENEWFFKVHWPNDPNMPGMLQIEALVQTAAISILSLPNNKGKVMYLTTANNVKFKKKVTPKKRFFIKTKIISYKRGIANCVGTGIVDNQEACKAEFNLILPSEIEKYNINKEI